ncbi:MAG: flagellar export chaperone FliS [Gemmatimonadetes bacterium]|nr:flagellar export chaperone FliS [Gemmatimonadota bacterium]
MYGQGPTAYRDTEVLSSSPERLIPLMYEGILVSLRRGRLCMSSGDLEGKFANLQRAQDLIYELLGSLDHERGGDIAGRLSSLYTFWVKEISEASRTLDAKRLAHVADMISELHSSWVEAVRIVEARPPAAAGGVAR